MTDRVLQGIPASPGVALGTAWMLDDPRPAPAEPIATLDSKDEHEAALDALAAAGDEVMALAATLSAEEADIVATGALIAQDPMLARGVEAAINERGMNAADAILHATEAFADVISALDDPTLSARADDVRSLGRRAARHATGSDGERPPEGDLILIARDLGPADVAELATGVAGVALAAGGVTAHAAIVARSLGIPAVTGLGEHVLTVANGSPVSLDGQSGELVVDPSGPRARLAASAMCARLRAASDARAHRDRPAVTTDGVRIGVLANVAGPSELAVGLEAGAEGIGLLRTELSFLDAPAWPDEAEHRGMLERILAGLGPRPAIVRVLDFGADKAPLFVDAEPRRGLALLLAHPDAFAAQARAIVAAAERHDVRILLPMVDTAEQVAEARKIVATAARALGASSTPPIGAMIETTSGTAHVDVIAAACEFLSIGTNDLTAALLGQDRFAVGAARAHHPRVLRAIAASVAAARGAGIGIEVCGEAASEPVMLPLLVGLGIDEVSVGAARVGTVRDWIRRLSHTEAAEIAARALALEDAEAVAQALGPIAA
jgi:phosphoenolpyruvate-protein kinase (PTS system EI component)